MFAITYRLSFEQVGYWQNRVAIDKTGRLSIEQNG